MTADSAVRHFDLNIGKILEGWEVCHGVREIIANALDEQMLSKTKDVQIVPDGDGSWHIRDFGRGLKYEHLTQNENQEKLGNANRMIGKFGVGLKDALATLNRRGIDVLICSKFGDITLGQMPKHGFSDVVTLHAVINPPKDASFVGTDVILRGVSPDEIADAKSFFLKFSTDTVLDETAYGQILKKDPSLCARIYVTGMRVAEEENFAFSYNITSLTAAMRKALNRERTNVGRNAYRERIQQMLLASDAAAVADTLARDLAKMAEGTNRDEVKWADVAVHACQILNASKRVMFVTSSELMQYKGVIDDAKSDGLEIVTVPENIKYSLHGISDLQGNPVRDLSVYRTEWEESFEFKFIKLEKLSKTEKAVFQRWKAIADLVGGLPKSVREIKISETMRPDFLTGNVTEGLWEPASHSIIILRSQLKSLPSFAGTVLHEIAHAKSGYDDVTRDFENELTHMLGEVVASTFERH